jgi:RimJ/RimL family protein N-acetyltransferase
MHGVHVMLTLRLLTGAPAEMDALQRVFEAAPGYFHAVTGLPPGEAEAQSEFTALPPGRSYDDKFVWGLYRGDEMIGCADVLRGYPDPSRAVIGLLLITERWQRQGLGRAFATLVEQNIAAWPQIERFRLGVIASNPGALAFWHRMGYVETGEVKPTAPPFRAEIIVLEKPLMRRHA